MLSWTTRDIDPVGELVKNNAYALTLLPTNY